MSDIGRGVGMGAPGLGAPEPDDHATHTHTIVTRRYWPDGHIDEHRSVGARGEASAAHDRLAKRWKDAGKTFIRDKAARTLTKERADDELQYLEVVLHEPTEATA